MRRVHNVILGAAPVALAAALLFALAPACAMPQCAGAVGLAGPVDHGCCGDNTDSGCDAYMMVDDTPASTPVPQAPLIAVVTVDTVADDEVLASFPHIPVVGARCVPDDPLGVRLRI